MNQEKEPKQVFTIELKIDPEIIGLNAGAEMAGVSRTDYVRRIFLIERQTQAALKSLTGRVVKKRGR